MPGLPPAAVLEGAPGLAFAAGTVLVDDVTGDGLDDLIASYDLTQTGSAVSLVLDRPLLGGSAEARVAAVLPFELVDCSVSHAGDTNHDGVGDLWWGSELYRGPLVGTYEYGDAPAEIYPVPGWAFGGGFDADEDGELDVAIGNYSQALWIIYGPFEGNFSTQPGDATYDESRITRTQEGEACLADGLEVLGAVNEPGEVVLVAGSKSMPWCGGSLWAYDVRGPRGRTLRFEDAFAEFSADHIWFERLPDSDGDGLTDVLYLMQPYTAPIEGFYHSSVQNGPELGNWENAILSFPYETEAYALEDVTGDGLGDILVRIDVEEDPLPEDPLRDVARSFYAVPGTLRGLDLDPSEHGVLLQPIPQVNPFDVRANAYHPKFLSGDLDGDGLAEIVAYQTADASRPGPSGWIWIYLGRDLRDAFAALGSPATPETTP